MVLITCGPPAAGKSTVAESLQERLAARGLTYRILDSDEFRRDTYDRMYGRVADSSANWLLAGTFYKSEFLAPFEDRDGVAVVLLWCDLETCLERNRRRADPIDESADHIVWREFERPDEGLVIDVTDRSPAETVDEILGRIDFDSEGS